MESKEVTRWGNTRCTTLTDVATPSISTAGNSGKRGLGGVRNHKMSTETQWCKVEIMYGVFAMGRAYVWIGFGGQCMGTFKITHCKCILNSA